MKRKKLNNKKKTRKSKRRGTNKGVSIERSIFFFKLYLFEIDSYIYITNKVEKKNNVTLIVEL